MEPVYELVNEAAAKDWKATGAAAARAATSDSDLHSKLVYELIWHALGARLTAAQLGEVLLSLPEIESILADAFW